SWPPFGFGCAISCKPKNCLDQNLAVLPQFLARSNTKIAQQSLAFRQDRQSYLPPVSRRSCTANQFMFFTTINQLHHAVMVELHPLSQMADGWLHVFRQSLDRQNQLILLGIC